MKTWTEAFELLQKYAESEGRASVPYNYVTDGGYKLGAWVASQRHFYRQGKLSAERQKSLEQLKGWVWNINILISEEMAWIKGFEHLWKYAESMGHASVPLNYVTEDGFNLGQWVEKQQYAYCYNRLSKKRQAKFESLPDWVWYIRRPEEQVLPILGSEEQTWPILSSEEIAWMKSFEHLRKYAESKGHASVPLNYVSEDGYSLGSWVLVQRYTHRQGKLSAERQKALEQLPGWAWNTRTTPKRGG